MSAVVNLAKPLSDHINYVIASFEGALPEVFVTSGNNFTVIPSTGYTGVNLTEGGTILFLFTLSQEFTFNYED
jgi:hypothetical protein